MCDVCEDRSFSVAAVRVHVMTHSKIPPWLMVIVLLRASPCNSDPIHPVYCSALNVTTGDAPGCVVSKLLSPRPDRTIHIGGQSLPSDCLAACSAVHGEATQALAVHRQVFIMRKFFLNCP